MLISASGRRLADALAALAGRDAACSRTGDEARSGARDDGAQESLGGAGSRRGPKRADTELATGSVGVESPPDLNPRALGTALGEPSHRSGVMPSTGCPGTVASAKPLLSPAHHALGPGRGSAPIGSPASASGVLGRSPS
mmetsp:Transcript_7650/g.18347  ORF Transcript_7650/g.18347 Transcript_7650/m.18347 type:complete len:140 (+) Transcript_7650:298-717(+)